MNFFWPEHWHGVKKPKLQNVFMGVSAKFGMLIINPTSQGISDSVAPTWVGGPQRPPLETIKGTIFNPLSLLETC